MGYFQNHYRDIVFQLNDDESETGLRKCQMGAFWATLAHFTSSNEPALISMPTGSGKTALMMMLAFGLKANRVLIVVPGNVIKDQIAKKISLLDDLEKAEIIPRDFEKPMIKNHKGRIISEDEWEGLRQYDVVVATPHTISTKQHSSIIPPPEDLFDIVFFDEAHHTPAKTWNDLLTRFKPSKCILLTATPFRQDKQEILARTVYKYSMRKAMEDGIYQPIDFHPITPGPEGNTDLLLCEKAIELFGIERDHGNRIKILIRTDEIRKSRPLLELYISHGIRVEEINSKKSWKSNEAILNALNSDELDGIICVGMLGEGLDIPELKIAIFHDPPQSFPFTLQFIGRISRPLPENTCNAYVVANPDDVKGKIRELYFQDLGWRDFIPNLVDTIIGRREALDQIIPFDGNYCIDPRDLYPFFSSRLYRIEEDNIIFHSSLDIKSGIISHKLPSTNQNFFALITESMYRPPWSRNSIIKTKRFDLHLYYYHQRSKTLFESTTSENIALDIKKKILNVEYSQIPGEVLLRCIKGLNSLDYLMVGLSNALGQSPSLPSYKILMGKELQSAVKPSEGRVFSPGHALVRFLKNVSDDSKKIDTRGIGSSHGKIWTIRRGSIKDYIEWCDEIGENILQNDDTLAFPEMEFFKGSRKIKKFPDNPIAVILDYGTIKFKTEIRRFFNESRVDNSELKFPEISIIKLSTDMKELYLLLQPNTEDQSIQLIYNIENNQWTTTNERNCEVRIDVGTEIKDYGHISDFFSDFPPWIYLGNGGVIRNGELSQPDTIIKELPNECIIQGLDWSQCDIQVEYNNSHRGLEEGKLSVHDWLEGYLKERTSPNSLILKDHANGEIADFISIIPEIKEITLYHCKASRGRIPSAAVLDLKGLEQILRSIIWIRKKDLINEIIRRHNNTDRPNSTLVKGTSELAQGIADEFFANEWNYYIILVNPGLNCNRAKQRRNTNTLLITCYEWISNLGAQFRIMGN